MQFKVRKIAVLGGGTAGWSAASMLAERFRKHDVQITLVESPRIASVGVGEATVPGILGVHRSLNIDEREFIKATNATLKLGIEFRAWNYSGGRFFHPFSQFGAAIDKVDFHQCWNRLNKEKRYTNIEDYSLCASLAKAGRFALPDNGSNNPLAWYGYAYHFDASLYARFLRDYAESRGVIRLSDTVHAVQKNPDNGFIDTLHLESGEKISADLFFDCSGFRSRLLGAEMAVETIDWSKHLPCDRAVAVQTESEGPLLPYTSSTAMSEGWRWRIPLQNRTGNGYVYSSNYIDDEQAENDFLSQLSEPLRTEPRVIQFKAGMRKKFWEKNCIAIGLASGFIEPLESTSISLMHTGVDKAIVHMPDLLVSDEGIDRANELNRLEYEGIRDFIILHYWASKRDDSQFWRDVRKAPIPDTLATKIAAYMENGALLQYPQESFREPSWLAMYNGFELHARDCDSSAKALPIEQIDTLFSKMRSAIEKGVSHAPSHADFLRSVYD